MSAIVEIFEAYDRAQLAKASNRDLNALRAELGAAIRSHSCTDLSAPGAVSAAVAPPPATPEPPASGADNLHEEGEQRLAARRFHAYMRGWQDGAAQARQRPESTGEEHAPWYTRGYDDGQRASGEAAKRLEQEIGYAPVVSTDHAGASS